MPGPDPWRKAYNLSRARTPANTRPGTRSPSSQRELRRVFRPWLHYLLFLIPSIAVASYVWIQRGTMIPRYVDSLPEPIARTVERTPLPRQSIDAAVLDGGLGIGLAIGGDYLSVFGATRDWGVDWKLIDLGNGHTRAIAPGLTVYAENGKLLGYKLDVAEVFSAETWAAWRNELIKAGLSPEVNWRVVTGATEMPSGVTEHMIKGRGGLYWGSAPSSAAYTLQFRDGWLTGLEGGLQTGDPLPEAVIAPQVQDNDSVQPVEVPTLDG